MATVSPSTSNSTEEALIGLGIAASIVFALIIVLWLQKATACLCRFICSLVILFVILIICIIVVGAKNPSMMKQGMKMLSN